MPEASTASRSDGLPEYRTPRSGDHDCLRRTGRDAGAAAGAGGSIELGQRHATESRTKADRACVAVLAAHTALDAARCETGFADLGDVRPGGRVAIPPQGRRYACSYAVGAEGALTAAEVDARKPAAPGDDDAAAAGTDAVATTRAALEEFRLRQRPGRADGRHIAPGSGTEECTTGWLHVAQGGLTPWNQDGPIRRAPAHLRLDRHQAPTAWPPHHDTCRD